tara:strand:+ start:1314 stop:1511 length:198 start_codon:yes stop_codon:yes gene_type:complete
MLYFFGVAVILDVSCFRLEEKSMTDDLKGLEKEAEELRQNLWVWKGISFLLLVLYLAELGGWFSG